MHANGADERHQPGRAAQIATEVGAQRGEADRDSDEDHHLAEQPPSWSRAIALAGERPVVVGALDGAHVTTTQGNGKTSRRITMSQPSAIHHVELNPMRSVRRRGSGRR